MWYNIRYLFKYRYKYLDLYLFMYEYKYLYMVSICKCIKIFTGVTIIFPITSCIVRFIKCEDNTNNFAVYLQGLKICTMYSHYRML